MQFSQLSQTSTIFAPGAYATSWTEALLDRLFSVIPKLPSPREPDAFLAHDDSPTISIVELSIKVFV